MKGWGRLREGWRVWVAGMGGLREGGGHPSRGDIIIPRYKQERPIFCPNMVGCNGYIWAKSIYRKHELFAQLLIPDACNLQFYP